LIIRVDASVTYLAKGRQALDIEGEAEAGRVSYNLGLQGAQSVFTEAAEGADVKALILAEQAFLAEEKRYCDEKDADALGSLATAIASFDDALLAVEAVGDATLYRGADLTFPHQGKYRIKKMPKDAFHIACIANTTRLRNTLKTPGINMKEKAIYQQRAKNMGVARRVYFESQQKALGKRF
jgi:predicted ATP-grasp superfamily ATP-dependent carboligase